MSYYKNYKKEYIDENRQELEEELKKLNNIQLIQQEENKIL